MKDSGHSRLWKLLRAGRLIHQAAKTFGLTGERRRRDIPKETLANRQKAIGEHSRRNREGDPAAAQARPLKRKRTHSGRGRCSKTKRR